MSKYLIATIKSWNIERARGLAISSGERVSVITEPGDLTYERVKAINPRYIFFPHWSWKIPQAIYLNWECVLFHMTDLPFGRGGSPLQNLVVRGIKETKVTALKVIEGIDAGPIYIKSKPISLSGSAEEIYKRVSELIFEEMIPFILKNSLEPNHQVGEPINFKRRAPSQSDLAALTNLNEIYDHIRMLDGEGYPKAFLENNGIRYEFSRVERLDDQLNAEVTIKRRKEDDKRKTN